MTLAAALVLAWLLDAVWGEPPNRWHPVARLGTLLRPLGAWARAARPAMAFARGTLAWCALAALVVAAATAIQLGAAALPAWLGVPLLALVVKPGFAWRMLRDETAAVETALAEGGSLDTARARLARLVSRDVSAFDDALVRETALETLAENLNDSVVAPLFWFALAGLPGIWLYRFSNTADAMWGYRGPWEWAGKWAARADDLLSWLPARLTALLLAPGVCAQWWPTLVREACRTPSPNGGWPMAALAMHLGVRLRKPGVYALNADAPSPAAGHACRAAGRANAAAWCAALLCALVLLALPPLPFLGSSSTAP
jgi:adenosylcobinamide-phosphate synthase